MDSGNYGVSKLWFWVKFGQFFCSTYKSLNLFMSTVEHRVETCPIGKSIKNGYKKWGLHFRKTFFSNFLGSWFLDSKNGKKIFLKILPKNFWKKICEKISGKKIFNFFFRIFWIYISWSEKICKNKITFRPPPLWNHCALFYAKLSWTLALQVGISPSISWLGYLLHGFSGHESACRIAKVSVLDLESYW